MTRAWRPGYRPSEHGGGRADAGTQLEPGRRWYRSTWPGVRSGRIRRSRSWWRNQPPCRAWSPGDLNRRWGGRGLDRRAGHLISRPDLGWQRMLAGWGKNSSESCSLAGGEWAGAADDDQDTGRPAAAADDRGRLAEGAGDRADDHLRRLVGAYLQPLPLPRPVTAGRTHYDEAFEAGRREIAVRPAEGFGIVVIVERAAAAAAQPAAVCRAERAGQSTAPAAPARPPGPGSRCDAAARPSATGRLASPQPPRQHSRRQQPSCGGQQVGNRLPRSVPCRDHNSTAVSVTKSTPHQPSNFISYTYPPGWAAGSGTSEMDQANATPTGPGAGGNKSADISGRRFHPSELLPWSSVAEREAGLSRAGPDAARCVPPRLTPSPLRAATRREASIGRHPPFSTSHSPRPVCQGPAALAWGCGTGRAAGCTGVSSVWSIAVRPSPCRRAAVDQPAGSVWESCTWLAGGAGSQP